MILLPFDPWKSQLCTCPAKFSLNPYTGCPHGCLYCYASSYIPSFSECRPKVDLHKRLTRDVSRVRPGSLVAMSNSSDPYPPIEEKLRLSRGCLGILKSRGILVQIVTKSHLVAQDAPLLSSMDACVAITVTTLNQSLSRRLEPGASLPKQRLLAMERLADLGVPVSARIDPIIPGINDVEIEDLVSAVSSSGAKHITSSTYKARPGNLHKIVSAFPQEGTVLKKLFAAGSSVAKSAYLPADIRVDLMAKVKECATKEGLTFSTCREGLSSLSGVPGINCDGSHLLNES